MRPESEQYSKTGTKVWLKVEGLDNSVTANIVAEEEVSGDAVV